jgi:hypothetical protein
LQPTRRYRADFGIQMRSIVISIYQCHPAGG